MMRCWRAAILLAILACWASSANAQTARNILVVGNALSRSSDEIAQYYARKRSIPSEQILRLNVPVEEEISYATYVTKVERPIVEWLAAHDAHDRILYLVLTKDVPLRITGTAGMTGSVASLDSELTLLYQRALGFEFPLAGPVPNPYFAGSAELKNARPFSHRFHALYLVSRLDGYTVADVKALIDRGSAPSRDGSILLDGRFEIGVMTLGNRWLSDAATALRRLPGWNDRVVLDTSAALLNKQPNVLGYYSWGSNDRTPGVRHLESSFIPGALAGEFVSTDARTFQEPPAEWKVNDRPFRGSHQSLIGDFIRDGITGVAGHVAEPYLSGTIRPDILFPAYVAGFNLIESYYLAMPSVSWQTVVIGDPLCDPFGGPVLEEDDLDPPVDPVTDLPAFASARRVAFHMTAGARKDAAQLMTRFEVRSRKGDQPGARRALEQATAADPAFKDAQLALGMVHEQAKEWDLAIARYRQIVDRMPKEAVALNNLAYLLATEKKNPAEALPIAKRAYMEGKGSPESADTLAWVHYLLGSYTEAQTLIEPAVRRRPGVPDIRLHAAMIYAARNNMAAAARELEAALRLNPSLGERADAQELKKKITPSK